MRLGRVRAILRSDEFRRHPVRSVSRRLRWRIHWRLFPNRPLELSAGGMVMRLASTSASSGVFLNSCGWSDPAVTQVFASFLRPGMVAFDCGAHIGEYTLLFARLVGPGGTVHAFEPDPRVFGYLTWNVNRNALTNVRANMVALSSSPGHAEYAMHSDATASSLAQFAARGEAVETVEVPTTSLDAYAAENDVVRIDALKLDVEGAEAAVLAGADGVLRRARPGLVFVECHSELAATEVRWALEDAGYVLDPSVPERLHAHVVARRTA